MRDRRVHGVVAEDFRQPREDRGELSGVARDLNGDREPPLHLTIPGFGFREPLQGDRLSCQPNPRPVTARDSQPSGAAARDTAGRPGADSRLPAAATRTLRSTGTATHTLPRTLRSTATTPHALPHALRSAATTTHALPHALWPAGTATHALPHALWPAGTATHALPHALPRTLRSAGTATHALPRTLRSAATATHALPRTLRSAATTTHALPRTLWSTGTTPHALPRTLRSAAATPHALPRTLPAPLCPSLSSHVSLQPDSRDCHATLEGTLEQYS
jgi:hypothetical protein